MSRLRRPLRLATALMALAFALPGAQAAVRDAQDGVKIDRGHATLRRGAETLHPMRIDRAGFEAGRALELPSTSGLTQRARFVRSERKGDDFTWIGKVDTEFGEQSVVITIGEDAAFGTIPQRRGPPLRIETVRGRTWLVEGQQRKRMGADGRSDARIPPAGKPRADAPVAAAAIPSVGPAANEPVIDVLVAYTPSLVTALGSSTAVTTRLTYLESLTNQAYADSPANVRIRVVARKQINYTSASDNDTLLDLITLPSSNSVKTQIDSWRNQYGADLVTVVRAFHSTNQTSCGVGWIGGYHGQAFDPNYGFSVVSDGAHEGYYCTDQTFAHELGHNMGSHHDTETAEGDYGAYTYSRGYRKTISSTSGFATIMAYGEAPQTDLNRFSNPLLGTACMGQACGVSGSADNAKSLTNAAPSIAAFRATVNLPTLSVADVAIAEGDSGSKTLTFTVRLSSPATSTVAFDVYTANGTAVASGDYTAKGTTRLTIAAGGTTRDVAITVKGDYAVEPDETFTFHVANPANATIADGTATGTIVNDDDNLPPKLTIANVSVQELHSGAKTATFTVLLSKPATETVSYTIATVGGSATAGSDFTAVTASHTIAVGAKSRTFGVPVLGDLAIEPDEAYTVRVTDVTGATVVDGIALGTIFNDDPVDLPTLSIANVAVEESHSGTKTATFKVQLSKPAPATVTYTIATVAGSATANDDFTSVTSSHTIAAGASSRTFGVPIRGDMTIEPDEAYTVRVTNVVNATVTDGIALGTILNDDPVELPTLSIGNVAVTEGHSGTKTASFTVQLSKPAPAPVTYAIATVAGSATANDDFTSVTTSQTINAGASSRTFGVAIRGDMAIEPDEAFTVRITNVTNATLADDIALGTILNDDPVELPTLAIGNVSVVEGHSGTKTATFTVQLSKPAPVPVTYSIATVGGSAVAGVDFTNVTGTQTITAGTSSRTFGVPIPGDTTVETDEAFTVRVTNVANATVADGIALGTIFNDD